MTLYVMCIGGIVNTCAKYGVFVIKLPEGASTDNDCNDYNTDNNNNNNNTTLGTIHDCLGSLAFMLNESIITM